MSHFQGPDILQAGSLLGHLMEPINIIFTYAFTAMASQNGCHEKMSLSGRWNTTKLNSAIIYFIIYTYSMLFFKHVKM